MDIAILGSRGFPSTYGGYETFVRRAAPAWSRAGHTVPVYCRRRESMRRRIWETDGVRCIWTPGRDTKSASTLTFGLTSTIDAAVRSYDAALVLNVANGFFLPFLRAARVPTVLNTDGLEWKRGKWGPGAKRVFYRGAQLSTRFADVLVADSSSLARIWEEEFGVAPVFIPYGADIEAGNDPHRVHALGLQPHSYVLVVARLIPENNVELTLDALDRLEGVQAVVVGSANYRSPLEERLQSLRERKRLLWLGHVADQALLTDLWSFAGVYVHGHSVGGTNPALLQALGAGAPTLALDTPFNREVVANPQQLYPMDAEVLSARIVTVLSDFEMQQRWRETGQATIRDRYSWDGVLTDYIRALNRAAATTGRP